MSFSHRLVKASVFSEVEDAIDYSCKVRMCWCLYFLWVMLKVGVSGYGMRGGIH